MHNVRPHSLRTRILVLTLLFTLATALAITVISLYTLTRSIRKNTLSTAEYALQTAAATIRQDIQEIDSLADWCTYNPTLRTYMLSDMSTASLLQTVYPTVSDKYNSMRTNPYIQRFAVGNDNGRRLMFGSNVSLTYYTEADQLFTLAEQADDAGWTTIVRDPLMLDSMATEGILVTRVLQSTGWSRNAWVYLSVSPALITTPLQTFALAEGGQLYWQMGEQTYAIHGGALTPLDAPLAPDRVPYAEQALNSAATVFTAQVDGQDCLLIKYPIGLHGLSLLEAIPTAPLNREMPAMLGSLTVSLLIIAVLGIALTVLMRFSITRPILLLQERIARIGQGDFTADPATEWDDELGDIGRGINGMARSVTALMDKRIEDEKQKKDLEYRMLQNQINPHFIYNTLNSIKWMATIQQATGIAEMVTALSRLMKSVSKGNERVVPLYQEFALLNDYFTIQQYRYGGTVTLDVSYIENEHLAHDCLIPRFTLQPLVENAIFHGIEPKGCAGDIRLTVTQDKANGDVLVRLTDNGVGMTPEQLDKALQPPGPEEEAAKFRHVGVWNVHRRLQYSFGDAYGLTMESTPGEGTTVIIRLPCQPMNKEEV